VVNKINDFWIPACAGMTDFLRFFTFFNTLLAHMVLSIAKVAEPIPWTQARNIRLLSCRLRGVVRATFAHEGCDQLAIKNANLILNAL
jgi:hypothetical protein